jgi:hypothetical protein
LVESFARHFMVAIDAWQESGFGEVAKSYLARLAPGERGAPGHRRQWRSPGAAPGKVDAERRSLKRARSNRPPGSIP